MQFKNHSLLLGLFQILGAMSNLDVPSHCLSQAERQLTGGTRERFGAGVHDNNVLLHLAGRSKLLTALTARIWLLVRVPVSVNDKTRGIAKACPAHFAAVRLFAGMYPFVVVEDRSGGKRHAARLADVRSLAGMKFRVRPQRNGRLQTQTAVSTRENRLFPGVVQLHVVPKTRPGLQYLAAVGTLPVLEFRAFNTDISGISFVVDVENVPSDRRNGGKFLLAKSARAVVRANIDQFMNGSLNQSCGCMRHRINSLV